MATSMFKPATRHDVFDGKSGSYAARFLVAARELVKAQVENERLRGVPAMARDEEIARLYVEVEKLRRHRRYLNAAAIWFQTHSPGTPVPDWIGPLGWLKCEPGIDEECVDECEKIGWIEATEG